MNLMQPNPEAQSLAELVTTRPAASRVLHRHGLDFCCGGRERLADACAAKGLDVASVLAELAGEEERPGESVRWDERELEELIEHLLENFHAPHREELPRLTEMAAKVERVHADKPTCPKGLAEHLRAMTEELDLHMQKEEQVLFPMVRAGRGRMAAMPIQVMEEEHRDAGQALATLRRLAHDFVAPEEACNTWRALYLGLAEFERDLMQHVHLENNVLFPRVLLSGRGIG